MSQAPADPRHGSLASRVVCAYCLSFAFVIFSLDSLRAWQWKPTPDFGEEYLQALLRRRDEEGRDNALIHYIHAIRLLPRQFDAFSSLKIETIDRTWRTESGANSFQRSLDSALPMLEELRIGAATDDVRGLGFSDASPRPPLYAYAVTHVAGYICLSARRHEMQGRPSDALDDYLLMLDLGAGFSAPDADDNMHQNGISIQLIAAQCIHEAITQRRYGPRELRLALDRLSEVANKRASFADMYKGMAYVNLHSFAEYLVDRREFIQGPSPTARRVRANKELWQAEQESLAAIEASYPARSELSRFRAECMKVHWWRRDFTRIELEQEAIIDRSPPSFRALFDQPDTNRRGFMATEVHYWIAIAHLRQTQIAASLELYRLRRGKYPSRFSDLALSEDPSLVDPFSGVPFRYRTTPDRMDYELWSIGPDGIDDQGKPYDDPAFAPSSNPEGRNVAGFLKAAGSLKLLTGGAARRGDIFFPNNESKWRGRL